MTMQLGTRETEPIGLSMLPCHIALILGLFTGLVLTATRATIKRCVNSRGGEYPSGLT